MGNMQRQTPPQPAHCFYNTWGSHSYVGHYNTTCIIHEQCAMKWWQGPNDLSHNHRTLINSKLQTSWSYGAQAQAQVSF